METGTGIGVVKHVGAAMAGDAVTVIDAATIKAARPAFPVLRTRPSVFNFNLFMAVPIVGEMKSESAIHFGLYDAGSTLPLDCLERKRLSELPPSQAGRFVRPDADHLRQLPHPAKRAGVKPAAIP